MKRFLISTVILSLFALSSGFSQTVNDVPLKDIDVKYIQIVGTSRMMSNKVNIDIDFGQENKFFSSKETQVKDENGKQLTFNSMIDALNFFAKYSYEFESAYSLSSGNQSVYHFLLKKE
ncbi:hypothetical protein [Aequorivita marina]|uniref:hypothetical protein n=1 Tax=Aequorivita marina TaxID=3073654 RepID=UPI002876C85F|nr:hypothetical protein [Aequorivita sp. S2608]MDS1297734.1 hypothetical protein [Aequorivita sp. S2608]